MESKIFFDLNDVSIDDVLSVDKAGLIKQSGQGTVSPTVVQAVLGATSFRAQLDQKVSQLISGVVLIHQSHYTGTFTPGQR